MKLKSPPRPLSEVSNPPKQSRNASDGMLQRSRTSRITEDGVGRDGAARDGVPQPEKDSAGIANRKVFNGWKEIAAHLGRGVRTVQRYERDASLPVRRVPGRDRSSVIAFSDELDEWLNRAPIKERRYVRPTLVVLDRAVPGTLSTRKLVLEVGRFNVLTAYSVEEAYSTAEKFDVDAFVLDHIPGTETADEICESLKERFPKKPIFAVTAPKMPDGYVPPCVDYPVSSAEPQQLLDAVIEVFGHPRLE